MKLSLWLEEDLFSVNCRWRGDDAWFFPCGGPEAKLRFLEKLEPGAVLYYLRQEDADFLQANLPGRFALEEARDDWEYICDRSEQLELPGKTFRNLRAKIHKARHREDWTVSQLTPELLDQAARVIRQWDQIRGGDAETALAGVRNYEALEMQGVLLSTAEGPQAVAFGSMITPDTFDLHVTKTLMPGIDSYLKWELYSRLPECVLWINQEEDLGMPGLRTNKTESQPVRMIRLWKGTVV